MESIHCQPSSFIPIPSSRLANQHAQQRRRINVFSITKNSQLLSSHSHLQTRALSNAITIAADTTASVPHIGGDISVLIPVSAVLLFMYWIANFVVPEIVVKDLQRKASEGDERPEQSTTEASAMSEPVRKKLKKADLKKMIRPR